MDRVEQVEKVKDFHIDVLLHEVRSRYKRMVILYDGPPGDAKGYGAMYTEGDELACSRLCGWGDEYIMRHWNGRG